MLNKGPFLFLKTFKIVLYSLCVRVHNVFLYVSTALCVCIYAMACDCWTDDNWLALVLELHPVGPRVNSCHQSGQQAPPTRGATSLAHIYPCLCWEPEK